MFLNYFSKSSGFENLETNNFALIDKPPIIRGQFPLSCQYFSNFPPHSNKNTIYFRARCIYQDFYQLALFPSAKKNSRIVAKKWKQINHT